MNEEQYAIMNTHAWEAGCMHVHPEDVAEMAQFRKVECARCEDRHPSKRPCPHASEVTLELWGFDPQAVKATLVCSVCQGDIIECKEGCAYDD